jgi:hypothetical protein
MRKIGILAMCLVLALGAIGVGFAKWSETLEIDGIIETGWVDVQLSQCTNDPGPTGLEIGDIYAGSLDPSEAGMWVELTPETCDSIWDGERYDKNVASTNCVLTQEDRPGPFGDKINTGPNTITVTIENGYPSYWGNLLFDIENIGTIPVKVARVQVVELSIDEESFTLEEPIDLIACETWLVRFVDGQPEIVPFDEEEQTPDPELYEFSIHLSMLEYPVQIDPPEVEQGNVVYGDIDVHILQSAVEDTIYDFTVEIECIQWNLVP